jgi:hypothetical protein
MTLVCYSHSLDALGSLIKRLSRKVDGARVIPAHF